MTGSCHVRPGESMAKSFDELVKRTTTKKTQARAVLRAKELLAENGQAKITTRDSPHRQPMAKPKLETVRHVLYWSYANLAMARAAVGAGDKSYEKKHFMIRSRLYYGVLRGTMQIGSFLADERMKLLFPQSCVYCGERENLALDHLLPKVKGGNHSGDNIVYCCRSCNSSKGSTDFLAWWAKRGEFPPLLLLRRYLKLAIEWSESADIMDMRVETVQASMSKLPFAWDRIPLDFPDPDKLQLWVYPPDASEETRAMRLPG